MRNFTQEMLIPLFLRPLGRAFSGAKAQDLLGDAGRGTEVPHYLVFLRPLWRAVH